MTARILGAAMAAALLISGCAKITAPNMDFAGPTPSVDVNGTEIGAAFSHFTGDLTVSVAVRHAGPVTPATSAASAGSVGGTTTFRLSGVPTFTVGDVLTVIWSGPAKTIVGSAYMLTRSAQYRIVAGTLQVQTPSGGLNPGQSGRVCVALLPNAPANANVTLRSSVVSVTPATLHIPAGQSKATAAATANIGGFTCPIKTTSASGAAPVCNATNGVTASATFGGITIQGCGFTGQSCCGVNGQTCAGPTAPPPSVCPS